MWLVVLVGCRKGDEKFRKLLKANFADFTIVASPAEVNVIRSGKCIVAKFYNYQGGLRRSWGHFVRDGRRILMERNGRWRTSLLTVLARGDKHTHAKEEEYILTWLVLSVTGSHVLDRFPATGFQINLKPISMGLYNPTIHCLLTKINVWKTLKYTYTQKVTRLSQKLSRASGLGKLTKHVFGILLKACTSAFRDKNEENRLTNTAQCTQCM